MNNKQKLAAAIELIKEMGTIIRYLDENRAYAKFWIKDDNNPAIEHVPAALDDSPDLNLPLSE